MWPFDDEDFQTLVELGLTLSQAKIYLAMISLGVADAKKIAQTAGIDRGDCYRQIEVLQKRGLVAKNLGFPNKYNPINLADGIKLIIEKRNKESAKIQQKAAAMLKKRASSAKPINGEVDFAVIPKDRYGKQHVYRQWESIQEEFIWYSPIDRIIVAINDSPQIMKNAFSRGVKYRVIAELNEPTEKIMRFIQNYQKENPLFDIRFVNSNLSVIFTMWDHGKAMNFFIETATGPIIGSRILTTTNSHLIKVIKAYFETKWNSAMKDYPKQR